ncbi:MAG: universal stress protein [Solirubrobacteraceae bacterium]
MAAQSIVAGTDGSASAEKAVDRAGRLALALGATVHVVISYKDPAAGAWMAAASGFAVSEPFSDDDVREEAERIAARSRDRLASTGVDAKAHVCSGDPAQALISVAADEDAEMIVVGNRGMSGAKRLLGSVPNKVSHHARCGVLIVPTT